MSNPIDSPDAEASPQGVSPIQRSGLAWIPIRSLAPRHRPRILAHLLSLPDADRYLRFGHAASDSMIGRYVDQIDFEQDEVFGVFNRRLEVRAMAHLALLGSTCDEPAAAEFGVSVTPSLRGRGVGARLFEHAVLRARNRQVDTLVIHALSENTAMLKIIRRAGAQVIRDGADSTGQLCLPPEDMASHAEALVERQAAEIDYGVKLHARRWGQAVKLLTSRPG